MRGVRFDEDCQRLSVTAPADPDPTGSLPVLVWLHGGSYTAGAGDLPVYDPAHLVREHGVIVVAVTYRLGILGFLGDGERVPANLGLLDQLAALRWVHANIAAFGGDPDRVTLFGQSAGADAIAHLMISAGAGGLFRRAIVQSAPFGLRTGRATMTRLMLEAAGVLEPAAAMDALFEAQQRAGAVGRRFGYRAGMPFGTQYGHAPLPAEEDADDAWRAVAPSLDVLVGWTSEETTLFGYGSRVLRTVFGLPVVGRPIRDGLIRVTTDAVYRRSGQRFAELLAGAGGRVLEYELDHRPRGSAMGSTHAVELPLLFPSGAAWRGAALIGEERTEDLVALGAPLRRVWAEFARTGRVDPAVAREASLTLRRLP
jgi:para-nitrobenzyl esterase